MANLVASGRRTRRRSGVSYSVQGRPGGAVTVSNLQRLSDRGLISPPRWLPGNVQYETIMGSVAYGVSSDTSDVDVYGWPIHQKQAIFPHLRATGLGLGKHA